MIQSKQDYEFYLKQDKIMNGWPVHQSLSSRIKNIIFPNPIQKFLSLLRKAEYYTNCRKYNVISCGIVRSKLRKQGLKLGFYIPLNTFGPGLSLPHTGTIVVNGNTKVGANCRLHVCVNIGANGGEEKVPQIGDNVYIGPGAILFGDISIADNVTIGANATVNKSCNQQHVVLAGSPASIVKENYPNWIELNKVK